jgi:8-oxo-dGTP pyrophosphatase MutT (NUDIX family)
MWIDTYAREGKDADKVTLNIYFHATPEGTAVERTDPNEVAEIRWFAPDELPARLAFPDHVPAVLRAWRDSLASEPRPPATAPALRPSPARKPEPIV